MVMVSVKSCFVFLVLALMRCSAFEFQLNRSPISKIRKVVPKLVAVAVTLLISSHPSISRAETEFKVFQNDRYETSFQYPSSWEERQGEISGGRIVDAFVDPTDSDTSVSVVISPVPADFTRLTSFGQGKETIRDYVLPSGEGVTTTLITEKVKGEAYYAEYVVQAPNVPTRHVLSVFALRPQESVVGLTVQAKEEVFQKSKDIINTIVPSFRYQE